MGCRFFALTNSRTFKRLLEDLFSAVSDTSSHSLKENLSPCCPSLGSLKQNGSELQHPAVPTGRNLPVRAEKHPVATAHIPCPKCQVEEAFHVCISSYIGSFIVSLL